MRDYLFRHAGNTARPVSIVGKAYLRGMSPLRACAHQKESSVRIGRPGRSGRWQQHVSPVIKYAQVFRRERQLTPLPSQSELGP